MRVDYDSGADAMSIDLVPAPKWSHCDKVDDRVNVAVAEGRPVNVEILYPSQGIDEPLRAVAERYELDAEALIAAGRAALAAPDRVVTLDVAIRAAV